MLTDTTNNYGVYGSVLATSAPLTDEQKSALAAELDADPTGRGYKAGGGAFKSPAELLPLINENFGTANPEPMVPLTLTALPQGAVLVISNKLKAKRAGAMLTGQPMPDALAYVIDTLLPSVAQQESLDLTDQATEEMLGVLTQAGLLTQDEVTALTTAPDPAYRAELPQEARARALFGPGAVVEMGDLAAAVRESQGQG